MEPTTPPVESRPPDAMPASRWPTAIGVIGIVLASLGLLGSCCGLAMPIAMPRFIAMLEQSGNMPQEQIDQMRAAIPPLAWVLASTAIGLALSVLLMVGSIGLVRRRERSVRLVRIWAILQLAWNVVALPVGTVIQLRAMAAQTSPGSFIGPAFGTCFALLVGVGYPIFVLVWLSRAKVKQEIAQWGEYGREVI